MIVIVDTNIIISACLNASSDLYNIIVGHFYKIDFVTPELTFKEILRHRAIICAKVKCDLKTFDANLALLMDYILTLPDAEVSDKHIIQAYDLTKTVDIDDRIFIAFAIALDSLLWTGDRKLINGVRKKGFANIVTTAELKRIIKGL